MVADMKKTLITVTVLGGLLASNASAATYGGLYNVGGQFQQDLNADDAYRLSIGFEQGGIGAGVDYLDRVDRNPIGNGFVPYYGAGVGVGFANGVSVAPRAFVGTDFVLNQNARVFGELGGKVALGSGDVNVSPYGRVGVNFRLN